MAKRNPWAAVVGATVIAGGTFLGKKLKGNKKKDAASAPDAAVMNANADDTVQTPEISTERKCASCGNVDTSGARNCPLCFADMDPNADPVDDI